MRAMADYGNPETYVITNIRPVTPMAVTVGKIEYPTLTGWVADKSRKKIEYPSLDKIKEYVNSLSKKAFYLDASKIALDLGMARLTNVVMIGALVGSGLTPLVEEKVRKQIEILSPGGGFVFQQVHNILADVPAENIAAMFEAVRS